MDFITINFQSINKIWKYRPYGVQYNCKKNCLDQLMRPIKSVIVLFYSNWIMLIAEFERRTKTKLKKNNQKLRLPSPLFSCRFKCWLIVFEQIETHSFYVVMWIFLPINITYIKIKYFLISSTDFLPQALHICICKHLKIRMENLTLKQIHLKWTNEIFI